MELRGSPYRSSGTHSISSVSEEEEDSPNQGAKEPQTSECDSWVTLCLLDINHLLARAPLNLWLGSGVKKPVILIIPSTTLA